MKNIDNVKHLAGVQGVFHVKRFYPVSCSFIIDNIHNLIYNIFNNVIYMDKNKENMF